MHVLSVWASIHQSISLIGIWTHNTILATSERNCRHYQIGEFIGGKSQKWQQNQRRQWALIRLVRLRTNRPFRAATIWTFPDLCQTTVIPMGMLSNGKHGSKVLTESYISSGWPALKTRWMRCTCMGGQNWSNCWTIYLTRQTLISLTPAFLSTWGLRGCSQWIPQGSV